MPRKRVAMSVIEVLDSDDERPIKRSKKQNRKESSTTGKRWPNANSSGENIVPNSYEDVATTAAIGNPREPSDRSSFYGRRRVWTIPELLSETQNIDYQVAKKIVQLLDDENTIPFICRYRRDLVNHLAPERLRDIKNKYSELVDLRKRADTMLTQLCKLNYPVDEEMRNEFLNAPTAEELEFLYAPYKPASKGSLADRSKALGLDVYAERILYGEPPEVRLEMIVEPDIPELNTEEKVKTSICHYISHIISKHISVLEKLRTLQKTHCIELSSSAKENRSTASVVSSTIGSMNKDKLKFENYFNYKTDVRLLKPHQVLAINRGEKLKFLSVRVIVPVLVKNELKHLVNTIYMNKGMQYKLRKEIFEKSFEECYSKKLQPLLSRHVRADLNEIGNRAAIDVFAKNLKQLLLKSPLKGERIMGIDPGFTNGCKLAVISETADVLETDVIYPHTRKKDPEECTEILTKMLLRHNCNIIALGNGTACRETEQWLTKLFQIGMLDQEKIRYSIVSEQGASIYSCSDIARKEFPDMDVNEISAVSIARRLNDPLSEYVKIEPRHIGVGMYQHDVNEKTLNKSLYEVVSEVVSYVGVDLNTASINILKHVAGLTDKKAEKIIEYRTKNGPFKTRKDLLKVKSIGEKTFIQCAGFVRIEPRSVGGNLVNWLDCTWVHPESYEVANKIIQKCCLNSKDIGQKKFVERIKTFVQHTQWEILAEEFNIPVERLEIVLVALKRELDQDYRSDFDLRPLFKHGIIKLSSLSVGDVVTGAVSNVTQFGAFVDIGVECDGLIHISKMNDAVLSIGDRVTVSICNVNVQRRRIQLKLNIHETDTSVSLY